MEKLVIVAISLTLLTESLDRKQVTALFISTMFTFLLYHSCWRVFFSNLGRKCIISEEQFVLELRTSRAMLATARSSCYDSCSLRCMFVNTYLRNGCRQSCQILYIISTLAKWM